MALDDVATLDRAALERFTTELILAGFEPVAPGGRSWEGPVAGPFASLTRATRMRIDIPDGWPFLPPRVFVQGLASEHVTAGGWVCLWQAGAAGGKWISGVDPLPWLWHGFDDVEAGGAPCAIWLSCPT